MRSSNSRSQPRFFGAGLAAAISLSLAACSGMRINSDFDPQASFSSAGRYDWADSTKVLGDNTAGGPFLERRIVRAVDQTLNERGFVRDTVSETVDVIVTAFVMEPVPADFTPVSSGPAVSVSFGVGSGYPWHGWGYPWGWYRYPFAHPWGWGYGAAPIYSVGFGYTWVPQPGFSESAAPGTLVVDIFDGASGELIWRGWAERAMREAVYSGDVQQFLNETVAKMLESYPPVSQEGGS